MQEITSLNDLETMPPNSYLIYEIASGPVILGYVLNSDPPQYGFYYMSSLDPNERTNYKFRASSVRGAVQRKLEYGGALYAASGSEVRDSICRLIQSDDLAVALDLWDNGFRVQHDYGTGTSFMDPRKIEEIVADATRKHQAAHEEAFRKVQEALCDEEAPSEAVRTVGPLPETPVDANNPEHMLAAKYGNLTIDVEFLDEEQDKRIKEAQSLRQQREDIDAQIEKAMTAYYDAQSMRNAAASDRAGVQIKLRKLVTQENPIKVFDLGDHYIILTWQQASANQVHCVAK